MGVAATLPELSEWTLCLPLVGVQGHAPRLLEWLNSEAHGYGLLLKLHFRPP